MHPLSALLLGSLLVGMLATVIACLPSMYSTCPKIHIWTRTDQAILADELKTLPQDSLLLAALLDYNRLRDEVRTCQ